MRFDERSYREPLSERKRIPNKPVPGSFSNSEIRTAFCRSSSSTMRSGKSHSSRGANFGGHPNRWLRPAAGPFPADFAGSLFQTKVSYMDYAWGFRFAAAIGGELVHCGEVVLLQVGMFV